MVHGVPPYLEPLPNQSIQWASKPNQLQMLSTSSEKDANKGLLLSIDNVIKNAGSYFIWMGTKTSSEITDQKSQVIHDLGEQTVLIVT